MKNQSAKSTTLPVQASSMKQLLLTATALLFLAAVPSLAQQTGASVVRGLYEQLSGQGTYNVEMKGTTIVLRDRKTGAEVVSVSQLGSQQVKVTGIVGNLGMGSTSAKKKALQRIALFNYSSPVGTLYVDPSSGDVVIYHNLNPRLVPVSSMANVALRCGDVARAQSGQMMQ